jgi:hypothetical protein
MCSISVAAAIAKGLSSMNDHLGVEVPGFQARSSSSVMRLCLPTGSRGLEGTRAAARSSSPKNPRRDAPMEVEVQLPA